MWAQPNVRVDYERYVWHPAQYQQDSWTNIFIRAYFPKYFGISRIEAAQKRTFIDCNFSLVYEMLNFAEKAKPAA